MTRHNDAYIFRRVLSVLLALAVCFAAIPVFDLTANSAEVPGFAGGNGTEETPYLIATKEQLKLLADYVNGGETFEGVYFKMTTHIVLDGESDPWTPIGTASSGERKNFCGTFDGGGNEVRGLYINGSNLSSPTDSGAGLFGQIGKNGTVENLTVSGIVSCNKNSVFYGGIVGYSYGTVKNCTNEVEFTNISGGINNVGGVVGVNAGTVESCHNRGRFTVTSGDQRIGGITSTNTGTVIDCVNHKECSVVINGSGTVNFGGIARSNNSSTSTLRGCYNEADFTVTGESKIRIGGIVNDNNNRATVTNCYNTGNISGNSYAGGIVYTNNNGGTIRNCYNTGNISGNSYSGGIAARNGAVIENCYNTGTVTGNTTTTSCGGIAGDLISSGVEYGSGTVRNCYNYGVVSPGEYSGGIIGEIISSDVIENNYYLDGTAESGIGGEEDEDKTKAIDTETFASGEVAWLLQNGQDEQAWYQKIDNDAYPVLKPDENSIVYRAAFLTGNTDEDEKAPFAAVYGNNGKTVSRTDVSGTPERDDAEFITWSLTKKASDPFSSTTINGSDVEIYAVWSETVQFGDVILIPPPGGAIDGDLDGETVTVPDGTIVQKTDAPDITVGSNDDKTVVDRQGKVTLPNGDAKIGNANVDVPKGGTLTPNSDGTVTVPDETTVTPPGSKPEITIVDADDKATVDGDGNVTFPGGGDLKLGETNVNVPEGKTVTPNEDGTVTVPDGTVVTPPNGKPVTEITDANDEATVDEFGNITYPSGGKATVVETEVTVPAGGTLRPVGDSYLEVPAGSVIDGETLADGGILDENGKLLNGMVRIGNVTFIPPEGKKDEIVNNNGTVSVPAGTTVIPDDRTDYTVESDGCTVNSTDGTATLPEDGSIKLGQTEITMPDGGTITPNDDGNSVTVTDGAVVTPPQGMPVITVKNANNEATVDKNGNVTFPEGGNAQIGGADITVPSGGTMEPREDGKVFLPEDTTVTKNGSTITAPEGGAVYDPETGRFDGDDDNNEGNGSGTEKPGSYPPVFPSDGTSGDPNDPGDTTDPSTGDNTDPSNGNIADSVNVGVVLGESAPKVTVSEDSLNKLKEEIIANHLTPEEKAAVESGATIEIILSVEVVEDDLPAADKQAIEAVLTNSEHAVGIHLNIELIKLINGQQVGKITEINTPIRVTVEIPEELRSANRVFSVIRVHNGEAEILEDTDNAPDTITIVTDKFSTYAIVYRNATGNPGTGITIPIALTALASAVLVTAVTVKKRKMTE